MGAEESQTDATPDWALPRDIHEREPETGRTRFFCRGGGMIPRIGFAAIGWREDAIREWLLGFAEGVVRKRH